MKLYRIYTENTKKQYKLREILDANLPGYTLIKGVGYWAKKREQSLIIEYIGEDNQQSHIEAIALRIRIANEQKAVLVTTQAVDAKFI